MIESIKCPICKKEAEIDKNILKCKNCGFINDNYQSKTKIKEDIFSQHYDKELFDKVYIKILDILITSANKLRKTTNDKMFKLGIDYLSNKFQDNFKGYFEDLERRYKQ